ncbi:hypothetical protein J1899_14685 [Cytobacillus gottheilii]|uniref:Uncharacterized protein n=1 Tax=Cytobacillus gottheilii TaxID=859144 RepID=A0ABX8F8E6_9BACI|nr:hypothetical protein J1899_14685 [Cytobacillus gottheilii]
MTPNCDFAIFYIFPSYIINNVLIPLYFSNKTCNVQIKKSETGVILDIHQMKADTNLCLILKKLILFVS